MSVDDTNNDHSHMDEIYARVAEDPNASAGYAIHELVEGRLGWLAKHIRVCDYKIDQQVAKTILEMIEGRHGVSLFQITTKRREGLPPAQQSDWARGRRDFDLAMAVARLGGFEKRGYLMRACEQVSKDHAAETGEKPLKPAYIAKVIRPWQKSAISEVAEERMQKAFDDGLVDILGQPICPQTGFATKEEGA